MQVISAEIVRILKDKGWGLYLRYPKEESVGVEDIVAGGVVEELDLTAVYDIFPRVSSKDELDRFFQAEDAEAWFPRFVVPENTFPGDVRSVAVFSGGDTDEFSWTSGQEIIWTGLGFEDEKIRLFTHLVTRTYIVPTVFVQALESMPDITDRL